MSKWGIEGEEGRQRRWDEVKTSLSLAILCLLCLGFCSCGQTKNKAGIQGINTFDCNSLRDKSVAYSIAESIIKKHDNKNIWNLTDIDTTAYFTTEDYFTNTNTKARLVLLGGVAGVSAGDANHLLLILSCTDTLHIIWAGQVGNIGPTSIRDLDNDGIKEIVINSGMTWMGEMNQDYDIFNFKGEKINYLFRAHSHSVLEEEVRFSLVDLTKPGDTLESNFDCSLVPADSNTCKVQQITTLKISTGGKSDKEIMNKLKVITDTSIVQLKPL